jgi:hypothetical protein
MKSFLYSLACLSLAVVSIDIAREGTSDLNYNIIKIENIYFHGPFKSKSLEGKFLIVNENQYSLQGQYLCNFF